MSVSVSVCGLPVYSGLEDSVFPLHRHVQKTNLVVALLLSGELYLGVLFVKTVVELFKLLDVMRPEDESVVDVPEPHCKQRWC